MHKHVLVYKVKLVGCEYQKGHLVTTDLFKKHYRPHPQWKISYPSIPGCGYMFAVIAQHVCGVCSALYGHVLLA